MAISVKVDDPLEEYRNKISNFIQITKDKIIKNLDSKQTFDLTSTSSTTQYRLKNSIKTPLSDYSEELQLAIKDTNKSFFLCLDKVVINYKGVEKKEIPLIISEVNLDNNFLSTKKVSRLNPLISNLLFEKTSHFTISNEINEKIRLRTSTTTNIIDILNNELGETLYTKTIELNELDFKDLDFFNEILYFFKNQNSRKLLSSPFIAASLGIEKSKAYLEMLLKEETSRYLQIPLGQILTNEEIDAAKLFIEKRSFSISLDKPNNLINSFFEISNRDKIKTMVICDSIDKKNELIESISNFESYKQNIPSFNQSKTNFEKVYSLLNNKDNIFQKSMLEIFEILILSKDAKIYNDESNAQQIPKINRETLFKTFEKYDDYLDLLEKISKLGVFDSVVLSNAWFGSIVKNDEESNKIIEAIEKLINTLIPEIKTFSKELPKIDEDIDINSLNDFSSLIDKYKKLIEIFDFFNPDIFDANFDLFINALEKNPKEKVSFFEKRAIKEESKKYIRFGVQAKDEEDLKDKFKNAKEVVSYFKGKIKDFEVSVLPNNLHQIQDFYFETTEKINFVISKNPKVENIDALFETNFDNLESVLKNLLDEAKLLLNNLDQKQSLFESLKEITPFLEYIYSIMPNSKEKASIEDIKKAFNQYIFKEIYQVLLENNYELGKISRGAINQVFENYISSFSYNNFENKYLSIISLDEVIAVKNYDYDEVVLFNLNKTPIHRLWPCFYRTNSIVNIDTKNNINYIPKPTCVESKDEKISLDYKNNELISKLIKSLENSKTKVQITNNHICLNNSKYLIVDVPSTPPDSLYKLAKEKGKDNIIFVPLLSLFINWEEEIQRVISTI